MLQPLGNPTTSPMASAVGHAHQPLARGVGAWEVWGTQRMDRSFVPRSRQDDHVQRVSDPHDDIGIDTPRPVSTIARLPDIYRLRPLAANREQQDP